MAMVAKPTGWADSLSNTFPRTVPFWAKANAGISNKRSEKEKFLITVVVQRTSFAWCRHFLKCKLTINCAADHAPEAAAKIDLLLFFLLPEKDK
jgi:hypothetical protein